MRRAVVFSIVVALMFAPASGGAAGKCEEETVRRLLQSPETSDRLKAILNETVSANPGKSKAAITAIFDERKKQFAKALARQAVKLCGQKGPASK